MAFNEPAWIPSDSSGIPADPPQEPLDSQWNPSEADVIPLRGRHRQPKQRNIARGSTVLGVAAIAAVGAGGVATAQNNSRIGLSLPDLPSLSDMPGLSVLDTSPAKADTGTAPADTTKTSVHQVADAGEVLRARILEQAEQQQSAADTAARDAAEKEAAEQAAKAAAAKKVQADAVARKKAAEEKAAREAAEKAAALAASYLKPVSNYTLTAGFGQAGDLWSANHTGQDFAAPTGTPVVAIHGGTITEAGWAGSYGYRIVLTLDDGTEIWYCHLSSMVRTSGTVTTGETIGRVGATGNVTGPHLHLEVRPGGGDPIDPMPWLRDKGVAV